MAPISSRSPRIFIALLMSSLCILLTNPTYALSAAGDYQLKTLTQGGPASIRSTSESIYRAGYAEQEVTDTLAEILLQNYTRNDRQYTDALAWAAKALGATRNARYRATLQEVAEKSTDRKLNKHVDAALESLPATTADSYVKGTINLAAARENAQATTQTQAPAAQTTNTQANVGKITEARIGMSMEQVHAICGMPTATTSRMTGKAFIPFNFKGGDDVITVGLYKGQGKIVYDKVSRYTSSWKVREVIIDPNETGYP